MATSRHERFENHGLFCIAPGPLYVLAVVCKERVWRAEVVRLAEQLPASVLANLCTLSARIGADAGAQRVRSIAAHDVHKLLVAAGLHLIDERSDEEKVHWVRHVNWSVAHQLVGCL